jgi:mono/diheme cytochrome c family protein
MKGKIATLCLLILISGLQFLITGCASPGPLAVKQASFPADKVDARGLFVENCVICHGQNGRAHTFHGRLFAAQNLTDAKWQANTADDEIIYAIKTGPREMPAFEKKLSPAEIDALATYVRTFKPAP